MVYCCFDSQLWKCMLTLANALASRDRNGQNLSIFYRIYQKKKMSTEHKTSWILTGATVACVTALYLPCVQRTVPGGDSGKC